MHLKVLCYLSVSLMCFYFVQGGQDKVSVTVYYESLCPDSKKFFTSQLYPNLLNANISKWVNLTLVPYGKSTRTKLDEDQYQFSCHHGTYECFGNKIHACALHEIEKSAPTPAGQGFNPITVAFINCLMDKAENVTTPAKTEIDFHVFNCSDMNHVPNYVSIENCEHHPTGAMYLAEMGDLTDKLEPKLKSVPTIVFDGKHKMEESQAAEKDFVKVLCQHIKERTKDIPEECKSSAAKLTVTVLAFVLLLVKQLF